MKIDIKFLILTGATIFLGVVAGNKLRKYLKSQKKDFEAKVQSDINEDENTAINTTKWMDDKFPLQKYSSGARVKILQIYLKIKPDGLFGIETENALKIKTGKTSVLSQIELNALKPTTSTVSNDVNLYVIGGEYVLKSDKIVTAFKDPYGKGVFFANYKLDKGDKVLYLGKTLKNSLTFNYKSLIKGDLYFNLTTL